MAAGRACGRWWVAGGGRWVARDACCVVGSGVRVKVLLVVGRKRLAVVGVGAWVLLGGCGRRWVMGGGWKVVSARTGGAQGQG